jgi:hypothetical protein
MDESVPEALRDLIGRHGRALLDDPRRCEALLRDHCPDARREIAVLVSALREGVPQRLLGLPPASLSEATVSGYAARLTEELAMAEEAARWSVMTWAGAFRLKIADTETASPAVNAVPDTSAPTAEAQPSARRSPMRPAVEWAITGAISSVASGLLQYAILSANPDLGVLVELSSSIIVGCAAVFMLMRCRLGTRLALRAGASLVAVRFATSLLLDFLRPGYFLAGIIINLPYLSLAIFDKRLRSWALWFKVCAIGAMAGLINLVLFPPLLETGLEGFILVSTVLAIVYRGLIFGLFGYEIETRQNA